MDDVTPYSSREEARAAIRDKMAAYFRENFNLSQDEAASASAKIQQKVIAMVKAGLW